MGLLIFIVIDFRKKIQFTWWTYRYCARLRSIGWRLDNFLVSENLYERIIGVKIHDEVLGSDHCPATLELSV